MKLRFYWASTPVERLSDSRLKRIRDFYIPESNNLIEKFPGNCVSEHTAVLSHCVFALLKIPVLALWTDEHRIKDILVQNAVERLARLHSRLDEADYLASQLEGIERAKEEGRLRRLREELNQIRERIDESAFDIEEVYPFEGHEEEFPLASKNRPFHPLTPEERKRISEKVLILFEENRDKTLPVTLDDEIRNDAERRIFMNPENEEQIREQALSIIERYKADGGPIPPYQISEEIKGQIIWDCRYFQREHLRQKREGATPEGIADHINKKIAKYEAEIKAIEERYFEAEKRPKYQPYIEEQPDGSRERKRWEVGNYYAPQLAHVRFRNSIYIAFLRSLIDTPAQREPEEFRQIWLNPAEDIPFVLQALKDLEFIDENEVWRVAQHPNPLGPIVALIQYEHRSFFHSIPRVQIEKAFCQRFNIKRSIKGFKPENKPFENSKRLMNRYLKEHC